MTTLTTSDLIAWLNANTGTNVVIASTPNSATLELMQLCLDSAVANVEALCTLPETYPVDVELAILMHAARLWTRRTSPDGIATEFGVVRVSRFDPHVEGLLEPYRAWRFA